MGYALMAMSMIKPAEKYLRKLFNMDKGIANMASYDSGMKTVKDIGKAVATVAKAAIAVYTGGASAMASGALAATGGAASAAGGASGALGSAGGALGEAGGALGGAGETLGGAGDALGGASDALGGASDALGELGEGDASQPWITEDWDQDSQGRYFNPYNEEWMTQGELMDSFDAGDRQAVTQGFDDSIENLKDKIDTESEEKGGSKGTTIDAANVTLNAGSVSMGEKSENADTGELKTIEAENVNTDNAENDEIKAGDGISLDMPEIDVGEVFKNLGGLEKLGELGVDIFEGLGSIGDGLYVDGTAPTAERNADAQWLRGNIKEAGAEREKKLKLAKDNWANNKENISIMSDKYMPQMREAYKGKPEAYIRMKAEEKAKSALKDMSEYVTYGVTDVNLAYQLYQNANNNGFSPEQSVRNMAGYSKFNSSSGNVGQINLSGAFSRNDYTTVQAAIPEAKTYYDAGIRNVNDMAWVDYMAQKLGKSPEFAMKVDEALKKKGKGGKLSYNGKDGEMKKVIDQINSHYGG